MYDYGQYGYGNYAMPQTPQPQYNPMYQMPTQNNVNQMPQRSFLPPNCLPLTFVNGLVGAKAQFVPAGQMFYLKDSDSNLLFVKSADEKGLYTIKAYETTEIPLEMIGKPKVEEQKNSVIPTDYATKEDLKELITKNDFSDFISRFDERLNKLSNEVKNSYNAHKNTYNKGDRK